MENSIFKLLVAILLPMSANAEIAGVAGMNMNQFSMDGVEINSEMGFQGGVQYYYEVMDQVYFRTGGLFTQRNASATTILGDIAADFLYLDIPLTAEYRYDEMFSAFAGLQMAVLMSDDCTLGGVSCGDAGLDDEFSTLMFGFPIGGTVMFTPEIGMDVYYQLGLGQVSGDIDWSNTFGAQLLYKFY